ncbi:MAG: GDSL-type esterase/lipase family protein [Ruminococcus sp.]
MIRSLQQRILALFLCLTVFLMGFTGFSVLAKPLAVSAAQTDWDFDFGAAVQDGCTSVSASQGYDAAKGYGFRNTSGVKDVTASGSGALSDAVQFTDTENADNTFDVDLPTGLYRLTVTLGNTNRTSVYAEGMLQIVNMTGNNATDTIVIPITDGQLNIRAAAGKEGYAFTMSELKVEQLSADPTPPHTVWLCGDSTVCNYYPKDTSVQAGWGQVLDQYIDSSWLVRDMAASGQYAKGFLEAGQFDAIEAYGKTGDIFIISIGINDTNYSNEEEYYAAVTDMVLRAKAKGMTIYLVKQQGRATDVTNYPNLTGRWFGTTLDTIGMEQNVTVIDLFNLFFDYAKSIGQEATTALYMDGDTLHPNRQGAMKLAELAASQIDWTLSDGSDNTEPEAGAEIAENTYYLLKNSNSGLYMTVENGVAENNTNVSQQKLTGLSEAFLWQVKASADGYYYIYSALNGGSQLLLDLSYGKTENGTNIGIYENTNADAQLYKFLQAEDGSYSIVTKSSQDKSCVEVIDASKDAGANIQQWERNGNTCQTWILEPVTLSEAKEPGITGDLNQDGVINGLDLALMRQQLVHPFLDSSGKRRADTNADGDANITDCMAIQQYLIHAEQFDKTKNNSSIYFAEDMSFANGSLETVNAGFKDDAYVNLDNKEGSLIAWNVNVPVSGNYLCSFRIANGSTENRIMKIQVNNMEDYWMQDFLSTGGWTEWTERGIVLPLNAGENCIIMTSATAEGGPNLDTLHLELTEEPVAEPYIEPIAPAEPVTPEENGCTVYIAGDSTVQTYRESYAPQQGWGAYLGDYLGDNVTVSNHAIAGRSSKSFYDNGRLDTILESMQPGDYLLVQFGINDSAYNNEERYAPTCGTVPGTEGSFEYYIAKYIEGTKEKGGIPILVTTVLGLKAYDSSTGQFTGSYPEYCNAMKQLAVYYDIPCIDLNALMVDHYNAIGYDTAYTYHLISTELSDTDMTHFTETGANAVAKLVADEMKRHGIPLF